MAGKKRYEAIFMLEGQERSVVANGFGAFKNQTGIGFWVCKDESPNSPGGLRVTAISEEPGVVKHYITDAVIKQVWV